MQFTDENATCVAIKPKAKIVKMLDDILIVGNHRLKYLTRGLRDKDYERALTYKEKLQHGEALQTEI